MSLAGAAAPRHPPPPSLLALHCHQENPELSGQGPQVGNGGSGEERRAQGHEEPCWASHHTRSLPGQACRGFACVMGTVVPILQMSKVRE